MPQENPMSKPSSGPMSAPWWLKAWSVLAIAFGLLTLKSGGQVLFGGPEAREAAGDYVPFVLWFNFIAGFVYVVAGIGLYLGQKLATHLAIVLAAATFLVFVAFGIHVAAGYAFEMRTVIAITVRTVFWLIAAVLAVKVKRKQGYGS
jgi:hypothetical protein